MFKIVHASDFHIDTTYAYFSQEILEKRRMDFINSFTQVIDFCIKEKSDVLLISGDFYDKIMPSNNSRVFVNRKIKELKEKSDTKAIIISGNHDTPKSSEEKNTPIDTLEIFENAIIFSDKKEFEKIVIKKENKTLGIYGKSFDGLHGSLNPVSNLPKCEEDFGIAMIHGSLKELNPIYDNYSIYAPFSVKDCSNKNFNYFALGHYHNFQKIQKENTIFCYSGSTEKYSFTEEKSDKGFVYLKLNENLDLINLEFIKLETRKMTSKEIVFDTSISDINNFILNNINFEDRELLFRIILKGNVLFEAYKNYKKQEIESSLKNSFFGLKIDNELKIQESSNSYDFGELKISNPIEEFKKLIQQKIDLFNKENNIELVKLYEKILVEGIKELQTLEGGDDNKFN